MLSLKDMPTTVSSMYSAYANFAALSMLVRSMANELIPVPIRSYIYSFLHSFLHYLFGPLLFSHSHHVTLIVDESSGKIGRNQVFDAAEVYLRANISPSADRLRVSKAPRQKAISLGFDNGQEFTDTYDNINLKWRYVYIESSQNKGHPTKKQRYFELTSHKKHRDQVVDCYLPHVIARAQAIKEEQKVVKLYTRHSSRSYDDDSNGEWGSINLDHPARFETMAMDPDLKTTIKEDLDRFLRRKEFYKKVGKAWKRGYLLYGPPGTGKSSLIAAMANYLKFDVYDLELTGNVSDSSLRRTVLSTTNRSILVIEDIDCSVQMRKRQSTVDDAEEKFDPSNNKQLTLSGLLNVIDGLWSCCSDERIIVFTTNHKDRLDPALLRPGRMDVHIHMSYCTPSGFKILASNYLGIHERNPHPLCGKIQGLIESTEATPAEVAEELMKSDDADVALQGLFNFLHHKKVQKIRIEEEKRRQGTTFTIRLQR